VVDPRSPAQGVLFRPIRTTPNTDLEPEKATSYSLGVAWEPVRSVVARVGYWRTEYTDRIVRRSPQGILSANPNDPRVVRDAATGEIQRIDAQFFNAASVTTDGLDFEVEISRETERAGTFSLNANLSWLLSYDIREAEGGPLLDALGRRNETNSGYPAPEWRGFATFGWELDAFSASATLRHTGQLIDDAPGGRVLADLTTVDLQLSWRLPSWSGGDNGFRFSLGAQNIFDELPPRAVSTLGYEPRLYDPRGRILYVRAEVGF
jgi:iron complex outermembrane receptor protein